MQRGSQFANGKFRITHEDSQAHLNGRVHPQIAWAKLRSPVRGRGDREQEVVELNVKVPVRDD